MEASKRQSDLCGVLYSTALYTLAESLKDETCPGFILDIPKTLGWEALDTRRVLFFARDIIARVEQGAHMAPNQLGPEVTRTVLISLVYLRYLACAGSPVPSRGLLFNNIDQRENFNACSGAMVSAQFEMLLKSGHVANGAAFYLREQRGLELIDLDDQRLLSVSSMAA